MTAALFALFLLPALNDDADPRTLVRWASSRCEPAVSGSCGREPHGYCDASVGRCVCSPGRFGPRCEQMHYPACRLHPDGEMACDTFVGLMSCACRLSCEQRYGSMARFNTPLCWDESVSDEELSRRSLQADGALTALSLVNTSDFPAASASIVFRTDQWPLRGRCARKNIAPAKLAACTSRTAVGHNKARNMLGGDPVPNWRCPGSCSHRGTCLVPAAVRSEHAREQYPLQGERAGEALPPPPCARGRVPSRLPHRAGEITRDYPRLPSRLPHRAGEPSCVCHRGYVGRACEAVSPSEERVRLAATPPADAASVTRP